MWEIALSNRRKSIFLVVLMALLLFSVGYTTGELLLGPGGGLLGIGIALIIWVILTSIAFFQGKKLLMRISGGQKIEKADHPRLFNVVEEMVIASQLTKIPDIYIIDDPAPNAFATGRNIDNAAIAVTTGLLNRLNRDELQGVVAHEIGHVKNRDILFMTLLGVMLGAIVLITDLAVRSFFYGGHRRRSRTSSQSSNQLQIIILVIGIVLMILSPIIAQIIYFAASRKREYLADSSSAIFTRYPEGLARALEKIEYTSIRMKKTNRVTAPMYIVNPLQKLSAKSVGLFSTHPPTSQRIQILRNMAGSPNYIDYDTAYKKITGSSASIIPGTTLQTVIADRKSPSKPELKKTVPIPTAVLAGAAMSVEPEQVSERVRETTDAIWKAKNYRFIDCTCGAKLKVPPSFNRPTVTCLRCRTSYSLNSKVENGK
ncbi:M48 family metallopeptidase [bacterium]|nr:M48 family metallopeptidase [candidate division CSSED10-310 bacterium]